MTQETRFESEPATSISNRLTPLSPVQRVAFDKANALLSSADVIVIGGEHGSGKSLVLRHLRERWGGRLLTCADAIRVLDEARPDQLEEAIVEMFERAAADHDVVFLDDWKQVTWFGDYGSERPFIIWNSMISVFERLARQGKKIVQTNFYIHPVLWQGVNGVGVQIEPLAEADRQAILEYHLGKPIAAEEMIRLRALHRGGHGHQLVAVAATLRETANGPITAEMVAGLLSEVAENGNATLSQIEALKPTDLVGSEAHFELLERTVLLPMMQPDLARELGLRPARGVLLHGSPGTGKTTIGRVLAHQMKGKFFVIDGTVFSDLKQFFPGQIKKILSDAAACAPSVVFIDDADVIFRNNKGMGFARQLLSVLDGLAGESQREVCLMMTAMDVSDMPPALIRSGRMEVWIEMELPTTEERAEIIRRRGANLPADLGAFDADLVAASTEGFTPADMRSLVDDARGAAAYDMMIEEPVRPFTDYLIEAAAEINHRKSLMVGAAQTIGMPARAA